MTEDGGLSRRAVLQAAAATSLAGGWIGQAAGGAAGAMVEPFAYQAPQGALDDLRRRLAEARWPEHEPVDDWSQGVPLARLRRLNQGKPEDALTQDEMLDVGAPPVVELAVGCSIFPKEIVPAPRSWAERVYPNLIDWSELDRGGHLAAFEQPALFAQELRDCFRAVRQA